MSKKELKKIRQYFRYNSVISVGKTNDFDFQGDSSAAKNYFENAGKEQKLDDTEIQETNVLAVLSIIQMKMK